MSLWTRFAMRDVSGFKDYKYIEVDPLTLKLFKANPTFQTLCKQCRDQNEGISISLQSYCWEFLPRRLRRRKRWLPLKNLRLTCQHHKHDNEKRNVSRIGKIIKLHE